MYFNMGRPESSSTIVIESFSTILTILSDFVTIDDSDVIWNRVRIACQNRDRIVDSDRSYYQIRL